MARSGQRSARTKTVPASDTASPGIENRVGRPLSAEEAEAVAAYRAIRDAEIAKDGASDAAFRRYFAKLQAGEPTNGAATRRLENEANELSTRRWSAENALYKLEIDPDDVDQADGIAPLYRG
jgi:hypothetical protein